MLVFTDGKYKKVYLGQLQAAFHKYTYRLCYLGNTRSVTLKNSL